MPFFNHSVESCLPAHRCNRGPFRFEHHTASHRGVPVHDSRTRRLSRKRLSGVNRDSAHAARRHPAASRRPRVRRYRTYSWEGVTRGRRRPSQTGRGEQPLFDAWSAESLAGAWPAACEVSWRWTCSRWHCGTDDPFCVRSTPLTRSVHQPGVLADVVVRHASRRRWGRSATA